MSSKLKFFSVSAVVVVSLILMLLYTFRYTFRETLFVTKPLVTAYNQLSRFTTVRTAKFPPLSVQAFVPGAPFVTKLPPFRTDDETTAAFDSYRFEYYSLAAQTQLPPGRDSIAVKNVTLAVYFVDAQNRKRMAYTTFFMDETTPDKCFVHSFLKESRFLFLSCLSGEDEKKHVDEFLLLGFWYEDAASSNLEDGLHLVFAKDVEITKDEIVVEPQLSITLVAPYKFYLPVGSSLWILEPKGESFAMERSVVIEGGAPFQTRVSPKGYYYFFATDEEGPPAGEAGGGVVDTKNDKLLAVDDSCFAKTPKGEDSRFFNDTVDMFVGGPYKNVKALSWSVDEREATFEQTYCSGGGCAREGTGTLTIGDEKVICDISVKYEHLDEYD